ncbi:uncharacterized protein LOC144057483 isoform X2 [Vanacampus margaritifer]
MAPLASSSFGPFNERTNAVQSSPVHATPRGKTLFFWEGGRARPVVGDRDAKFLVTRMRRKAARLRLESSSKLSLHQRFSRVQTMRPHVGNVPESLLLLVAPSSSVDPQQRWCGVFQAGPARLSLVPVAPPPPQQASVWTRLGGGRVGFWTFRNKYGWRGHCRAALRRAGASARPARRRPIGWGRFRRVARGRVPRGGVPRGGVPRGGVPPSALPVRGRSLNTPTKKELDVQLDDYMSKSKSRLDADLDEYMSRSKKRLDADLDEYMALAGQTLPWDD